MTTLRRHKLHTGLAPTTVPLRRPGNYGWDYGLLLEMCEWLFPLLQGVARRGDIPPPLARLREMANERGLETRRIGPVLAMGRDDTGKAYGSTVTPKRAAEQTALIQECGFETILLLGKDPDALADYLPRVREGLGNAPVGGVYSNHDTTT
jgi:hypothetical protein